MRLLTERLTPSHVAPALTLEHCSSAGQEAPPTKVTTPLMRFLTEKHTPKTPKRTASKKVSTSEASQGQMYAAFWSRQSIQRTELSNDSALW